MKILFIGNYKDSTGYSNSAINYIMAMDAAGLEVVPRCIKLNNIAGEVPPRILELEKQSDRGCDICIQCALPHMFEYDGHFEKNIGIYFTETSHFRNSPWAEHINLMDEVWVCSKQNEQAALNSNVQVPIKVIPIPTDVNRYTQAYEPLKIPELEGKFVFYFIGELNPRKNLPALILAFHREFTPDEPIILCIKTSIPGLSPVKSGEIAQNMIRDIKHGLKMYPKLETYIKDVIITSHMTETEIMRLHATADCMVTPSLGEAWSLPSFDAMGMGRSPLVTCKTGCMDWIEKLDDTPDQNPIIGGVGIASHEVPVHSMTNTFDILYCGNENWYQINELSLAKTMRKIYEDKEYRREVGNNGCDLVYDYSHEKVGQQIRNILEN